MGVCVDYDDGSYVWSSILNSLMSQWNTTIWNWTHWKQKLKTHVKNMLKVKVDFTELAYLFTFSSDISSPLFLTRGHLIIII